MREILSKLAIPLRRLGFKGSGQNFRRIDGDFIFVINFQGSRWGDVFYINLGAQPLFIPAENEEMPDPRKLKEYECVLRTRVGDQYPWRMTERETQELVIRLDVAQRNFFDRAQRLRSAIESDPSETLLHEFCAGTTKARAALHLARACVALGHSEKALQLVRSGLELAGDQATGLRAQLNKILEKIDGPRLEIEKGDTTNHA
jgi:hypothetical protein